MVALNYETLPADWPLLRALSVSIAARTAASETRRLTQQRDATPRRQSGQVADIEIGAFLIAAGSGPEKQELLRLIATLV